MPTFDMGVNRAIQIKMASSQHRFHHGKASSFFTMIRNVRTNVNRLSELLSWSCFRQLLLYRWSWRICRKTFHTVEILKSSSRSTPWSQLLLPVMNLCYLSTIAVSIVTSSYTDLHHLPDPTVAELVSLNFRLISFSALIERTLFVLHGVF